MPVLTVANAKSAGLAASSSLVRTISFNDRCRDFGELREVILQARKLAGSTPLFLGGTILYQISVGALGILLATFAGTMGQFGLLVLPVLVILNLLSDNTTPLESMPASLIDVMQFTPTIHFVSFAQAVLYRAAGLDIVWPELAALAAIAIESFGLSLMRFRTTIASFG